MCQAKANGGQRCYSHASKAYERARGRVIEAASDAAGTSLGDPAMTNYLNVLDELHNARVQLASTPKGQLQLESELALANSERSKLKLGAALREGIALRTANAAVRDQARAANRAPADWSAMSYGEGFETNVNGSHLTIEPADPDHLDGQWRWTQRHLGTTTAGGSYDAYGTADDREQAQNEAEHAARWGGTGISEGSRTPWGRADHVRNLAPGITSVSTPSHGGYKLSKERNKAVHPAWRQKNGWYEEDCDWAIVATTFPTEPVFADLDAATTPRDEAATRDGIRHSERIARDWHPDAYETATGKTIHPGQSYIRDRDTFYRDHANDHIAISASMAHLAGVDPALLNGRTDLVRVVASTGGSRTTNADRAIYLVPHDEYDTASQHGFVIDPTRHTRLPDN